MNDKGNISVYNGMDPDSIYNDPNLSDRSITFFYIPANSNLYIAQFPTNHRDMLQDDDDLFQEVYSDYLKTNKYDRNTLSSRGQALNKGNAILGRIGIDGMTPLIAFWETERIKTNSEIIGKFLKALYKKIPPFEPYQNTTVLIIPNQKAITVGDFLGTKMPSPERDVKLLPKKRTINKTFVINGQKYNINDLQRLRASIHTKDQSFGNAFTILCHPDIDKYPELNGYKPASCNQTTPSSSGKWKQAIRNIGQYAYPEHTFKEWFNLREVLHIVK